MSAERNAGSRGASILLLAAVLTGMTACGDDPAAPVDAAPATLTKVAGDDQTATVRSAVAVLPVVRVEDAQDRPVAGVAVTFAVAPGGGSVTGADATTDSRGIATVGSWMLGSSAGTKTLVATVSGVDSVTFNVTATAGPAARVTRADQDSLVATVATAVAVPPAVRVTDAYGNPAAGVTVTFAVSSGGGSATGTAAVTDSLGIARIGSWTLGTVAGTYSLTARVAGLPTVTFTATGTPGPAATLTRADTASLVATVGTAVEGPPIVRVVDAYANPIAGVGVSFAVSSGGGSATGTAAVTDSLGVAQVGTWTLGTVAGINTLAATTSGLPALAITATARAGPPANLTKQAGDGQTGSVWSPVDTAPAVLVTDAYANPVPEVAVTFIVTSGAGYVWYQTRIGDPRRTDTSGTAAEDGWTLGPVPGTNTLVASVEGLPSVTFTAVAKDNCGEAASYALGSTVNGELATSDCRLFYGEYTDLYAVTVPTVSSVRFDMTSAAFVSHLSLFDATGTLVASEYYYMRVLLPAGDYVAGASGFAYDYSDNPEGGVVGPYAFSSTLVPENVTGCEGVVVTPGVTTTQRIETTDCRGTIRSSTYYYDQFRIFLTAGRAYTITMSSAEFDTYLQIGGAFNDDFGGSTDSQIAFTPAASGLYVIQAATYKGETTGSYTLVVQ